MSNAVRWTPDQLAAHQQRKQSAPAKPVSQYKSKWEERFAGHLDWMKRDGQVRWWGYETLVLRLPGGIRYRVDFAALGQAGGMQAYEVKGRMREPARIKIRQAIELYPEFEWYMVGADMTPKRLWTAKDVPATTK